MRAAEESVSPKIKPEYQERKAIFYISQITTRLIKSYFSVGGDKGEITMCKQVLLIRSDGCHLALNGLRWIFFQGVGR